MFVTRANALLAASVQLNPSIRSTLDFYVEALDRDLPHGHEFVEIHEHKLACVPTVPDSKAVTRRQPDRVTPTLPVSLGHRADTPRLYTSVDTD